MEDKKKGVWIIALILILISQASAVKLEYDRFFPECSFKDSSLSLVSVFRCGCYIFVPNAHLEAGYDLIIRGTGDGMLQLFKYEIDGFLKILDIFSIDKISGIMTNPVDFFGNRLMITIDLVKAPFTLVLDVLSGVIAYLALLLFEFWKTYLIIILFTGPVNLAFYSVALMQKHTYAFQGGEILTNPLVMSVIITGVILLGSIYLIVQDVGIFNYIII